MDGKVIAGTSSNVLHPSGFLEAKITENGHTSASPTALLILNTPISDVPFFRRLYDHSSYTLCADGAANRLYDLLVAEEPKQSWHLALATALPSSIHGDLDSITEDVRKKYEQLGVEVSHDPDQYSTDFGKGVKKIVEALPNVRDVLVLGSIGGRVDQGIGLLHEIYREQKFNHSELRFWLFSEASISLLLHAGTTVIKTPLKEGLITCNAGILPLYGKASITIEGFEWDVQDWPTEMGGQVSTSNHIVTDQVSISTDADVLFTVERRVGR